MLKRVCWVQLQTPSSWTKRIASVLWNWHRWTSHGMKTREGWEQGLVHSSEVGFICCGVKGTHSFHGQKECGSTDEPCLACYASRVCRQHSSTPGHFPQKASFRDKTAPSVRRSSSVGMWTWCERSREGLHSHWRYTIERWHKAPGMNH